MTPRSVPSLFVAALLGVSLSGCGSLAAESEEPDSHSVLQAFPGRVGVLRSATLNTPTGPRRVDYEEIDGVAVIEGDIVMPLDLVQPADLVDDQKQGGPTKRLTPRSGARSTEMALWPDGVVPYEFDPFVDSGRVFSAMAHWTARTPIRFVPHTTQFSYVRFATGPGCSSTVGRRGGRQDIGLSSACGIDAIVHEIGHAVGLWHEQSRADRDQYVRINWENIEAGREHNFVRYTDESRDGIDIGRYDYASIMHYGAWAFSKNGAPTITPLIPATIGGSTTLSNGDIAGVRFLYQELNIDRPGTDLRSFTLTSEIPLLCRAACARDSACKAYTYVRKGVSGPFAMCWLKGAAPAPVANANCISGLRGELETNVERPGSTYLRLGMSASRMEECRTACARDARCRSFSHVTRTVSGLKLGFCDLKDAIPAAAVVTDAASGVKNGLELNSNRPGADYRGFDVPSGNARECQSACASEDACQSFTFVRPGVHGVNARCYLKSGIPPSSIDTNCISGVKGLEIGN